MGQTRQPESGGELRPGRAVLSPEQPVLPPEQPVLPPERPAEVGDATRRTHLANERTYLAWWRTGLTALASGVAVGRLVPSVTHQTRWPYAVLGAGFALVGIATIVYGLIRQRAVREAVKRGQFAYPREDVLVGLTGVAAVLGVVLAILVIVQV